MPHDLNGKTCYMCENPAVTHEHAPPQSIFPAGHRFELITVPSCDDHNYAQHLEAEWFRNIVTLGIEVNAEGLCLFSDKVIRSLSNNRRIKRELANQIRPVVINGVETGLVSINMRRFDAYISGMSCALYFKHFNVKYNKYWVTVNRSALRVEQMITDQSDPRSQLIARLIQWFDQLPFVTIPTSNQEIFKWEYCQEEDEMLIYKYTFYEGKIIYAYSSEVDPYPQL